VNVEEKKDFDREAAAWDEDPGRVKLANDVADEIIREAAPSREMDVLDFGCGTGLVTLRLQPLVKSITGADSSKGMLGVLEKKIRTRGLPNVRTRLVDFEKGGRIEGKFHLLISSMTMHHVKDTATLFKQWHELLLPGGLLAAADLDTEDGSFHLNNTGVFHLGLDRDRLQTLLISAGFHDVRAVTAATMTRDVAGKGKKDFPVFLIVGRK
jgi:2-polyprenyl-3-methyl-5-hydroxy-6-metoxy-1,4-benzoquinol methylase